MLPCLCVPKIGLCVRIEEQSLIDVEATDVDAAVTALDADGVPRNASAASLDNRLLKVWQITTTQVSETLVATIVQLCS